MNASDYLSFRKMITPIIIQAIFWIGVALCVIIGIVRIAQGAGAEYGGGGMVVSGLLMLILGPRGVRVYCELIIVLFRINETVTDILNKPDGNKAV